MTTWTRITAVLATLALSTAVVVPAAAAAQRGRISAHLTSKSFTTARAGSVKLVYRFASRSSRFGFVLSRRQGTRWLPVRRVTRHRSFTGVHRVTVKSLFGRQRLRVTRYRLRVSGSANTVTLWFRIKPRTRTVISPRAGSWVQTSLSGPRSGSGAAGTLTVTGLSFTVSSAQTVVGFGFGYEFSGVGAPPTYSCSGSGFSAINAQHPSPIAGGRFTTPSVTGAWTGAGAGTFQGVFDSSTTAHGTAQFGAYISGPGCMFSGMANTGTFNWTAKLR